MEPPHRDLAAADDGPSGQSASFGQIGQALLGCAADGTSGALRVVGEPGGVIHVADGGVVAIDTPGAPGAEVVLLRSGRVPEPAWQDVFAVAAADGGMRAELIRRGLVGCGQLEALLRAVLADGMFALMSGQVEECRVESSGAVCLLPLEPPADPGWLLAEASRRLRVLAGMPNRVHHDRDRVLRGHRAPPVGTPLNGGQDGILALANGRRTARDMAFALGRGVYALTLEFARMQEAGLLAVSSQRSVAQARPGAAAPAAAWPAGTDDSQGADAAGVPLLPRRRRAPAGQSRRAQPAAGQPGSSSGLLRLLRPGSLAENDETRQDGT